MNKVTLPLFLTLVLCSCAPEAVHLQPSNFAPLTQSLNNAKAQTKKGEAIAKKIATNGTKSGSQESSQLLLTFQSLEAKQAEEEVQIKPLSLDDKTKTDLANKNADAVVEVKAQLETVKTIPSRDHKAFYILMILQTIACCVGPIFLKTNPYTLWIPTTLQAVACGVASFIIFSSISGLLIAFGVL